MTAIQTLPIIPEGVQMRLNQCAKAHTDMCVAVMGLGYLVQRISATANIPYKEWSSASRDLRHHYPRIIFCVLAKRYCSQKQIICKYINRFPCVVARNQKIFEDELLHNRALRELYYQVEENIENNPWPKR